MNSVVLPSKLMAIAETDKIDAYDVYFMRREVFGDDKATVKEAEQLLSLDLAVARKCREWACFLSEVLVDYIVSQQEPAGTINDDNARWLMENISNGGLVSSFERFEVLIRVVETAKSTPEFLMEFALSQLFRAITENVGPVSDHREADKFVICRADVELIRRLMFGFGGDGGMAVTQKEAEFLFDLNDQTRESENDPAWSDFFVRAVGNYLLATMGNEVPDRKCALAADLWTEKGESTIDTMINMLRSVYREALSNGKKLEENYARMNVAEEEAMKAASEVTSQEAQWLVDRIWADGRIHQNETALLEFLKNESPKLHPSLERLIEKTA